MYSSCLWLSSRPLAPLRFLFLLDRIKGPPEVVEEEVKVEGAEKGKKSHKKGAGKKKKKSRCELVWDFIYTTNGHNPFKVKPVKEADDGALKEVNDAYVRSGVRTSRCM